MELTKKVIENQSRFILLIDRKMLFTKPGEPIEVMKLKASGIIEAMLEAENYINDTVYLVKIAEKSSEIIDNKTIVYNEILINRGGMLGWRVCDTDHCEQPYKYGYTVEFDFFENLGKISVVK